MMEALFGWVANVDGIGVFRVLIPATVLLAACLAVTRLAGRSTAEARHLLLASGFIGLALVPLVSFGLPPVVIEVTAPDSGSSGVRDARQSSAGVVDVASSAGTTGSVKPANVLMDRRIWTGIWVIGVLILLLRLIVSVSMLRRLRKGALPWTRDGKVVPGVFSTPAVSGPVTFGFLRPVILLPSSASNWSDRDLDRALVHEREHIRRADTAVHLFARVVCSVYWFHPLVWIAWRQLALEAERACDDAVVASGDPAEYAAQLLSLARTYRPTAVDVVPGMAKRSDLARRITAVLDPMQTRGRAGTFTVVAAASLAVLGAGAAVRVQAVPAARPVSMTRPAEERAPRTPAQRRFPRLDRALLEAAGEGAVDDIRELVRAGANVNARIIGDGSPLIAAAGSGSLSAVRALLDLGADPNLPVRGDGSPLIAAAVSGTPAMVRLLLDSGARIDEAVPGDENALIQASRTGDLEIVRLLVERGADVNRRIWVERTFRGTSEWRSPLIMARRGNHGAVADFLIKSGAVEQP